MGSTYTDPSDPVPNGVTRRLFRTGGEGSGSGWQMPAAALVTAALIGAALSTMAWGQGRAPALAALLPLLVAMCRTRAQAFALGAGYSLAIMRQPPSFVVEWLRADAAFGAATIVLYGVIAGAVWSLGWSKSPEPWRKALAVVLAWGVALLPPAAFVLPMHPVIAWGSILPGSGWLGVVLSAAAPACIVFFITRERPTPRLLLASLLVSILALGAIGIARKGPLTGDAVGVVGVTTEWGEQTTDEAIRRRMASMGQLARDLSAQGGPDTVVWPAAAVGTYTPALYPQLEATLLEAARASGQTHVVGMRLRGPQGMQGLQENALVAFYPDGRTARAKARQIAPWARLNPANAVQSITEHAANGNVLALRANARAAVLFGHEEFQPWLSLLTEARAAIEVHVAVADTVAGGEDASAIQSRHSMGMAQLFGRAYVRAENRPQPAQSAN